MTVRIDLPPDYSEETAALALSAFALDPNVELTSELPSELSEDTAAEGDDLSVAGRRARKSRLKASLSGSSGRRDEQGGLRKAPLRYHTCPSCGNPGVMARHPGEKCSACHRGHIDTTNPDYFIDEGPGNFIGAVRAAGAPMTPSENLKAQKALYPEIVQSVWMKTDVRRVGQNLVATTYLCGKGQTRVFTLSLDLAVLGRAIGASLQRRSGKDAANELGDRPAPKISGEAMTSLVDKIALGKLHAASAHKARIELKDAILESRVGFTQGPEIIGGFFGNLAKNVMGKAAPKKAQPATVIKQAYAKAGKKQPKNLKLNYKVDVKKTATGLATGVALGAAALGTAGVALPAVGAGAAGAMALASQTLKAIDKGKKVVSAAKQATNTVKKARSTVAAVKRQVQATVKNKGAAAAKSLLQKTGAASTLKRVTQAAQKAQLVMKSPAVIQAATAARKRGMAASKAVANIALKAKTSKNPAERLLAQKQATVLALVAANNARQAALAQASKNGLTGLLIGPRGTLTRGRYVMTKAGSPSVLYQGKTQQSGTYSKVAGRLEEAAIGRRSECGFDFDKPTIGKAAAEGGHLWEEWVVIHPHSGRRERVLGFGPNSAHRRSDAINTARERWGLPHRYRVSMQAERVAGGSCAEVLNVTAPAPGGAIVGCDCQHMKVGSSGGMYPAEIVGRHRVGSSGGMYPAEIVGARRRAEAQPLVTKVTPGVSKNTYTVTVNAHGLVTDSGKTLPYAAYIGTISPTKVSVWRPAAGGIPRDYTPAARRILEAEQKKLFGSKVGSSGGLHPAEIVGSNWSRSPQAGRSVNEGDLVKFFRHGKSVSGRVVEHMGSALVIKTTPKHGGLMTSVNASDVYAVQKRAQKRAKVGASGGLHPAEIVGGARKFSKSEVLAILKRAKATRGDAGLSQLRAAVSRAREVDSHVGASGGLTELEIVGASGGLEQLEIVGAGDYEIVGDGYELVGAKSARGHNAHWDRNAVETPETVKKRIRANYRLRARALIKEASRPDQHPERREFLIRTAARLVKKSRQRDPMVGSTPGRWMPVTKNVPIMPGAIIKYRYGNGKLIGRVEGRHRYPGAYRVKAAGSNNEMTVLGANIEAFYTVRASRVGSENVGGPYDIVGRQKVDGYIITSPDSKGQFLSRDKHWNHSYYFNNPTGDGWAYSQWGATSFKTRAAAKKYADRFITPSGNGPFTIRAITKKVAQSFPVIHSPFVGGADQPAYSAMAPI